MRNYFIGFLSLLSLFLSVDLKSQVCDINQIPPNLRNGLVAYYPFCGNANDVSGNGLNGTVNGATLSNDRFSNPNSAFSFNGSSYIRINNSPLINFGVGSYSLSCWVKCTGANRWQHFITHTESTSSPYTSKGYGLRYDNNNPTFLAGNTFTNSGFETTAPPVVKSEWHNIISVVDVSNSVAKIFVDGVETFSSSILSPFINVDNNGFMYFGVEDPIVPLPSGPQYLTGLLDDIMIFNRPISSCEALQIYNQNINSIPNQNFAIESLQDTTRICGSNTALNAGSGFSSYVWNTGATSQTINPTTNGLYKVTVTNSNGCIATDSTYLSLINANIIQNDTTICKGSSITLSTSTSNSSTSACTSTQLPANLRNGLVAYYPFCGNANDATGNGNNGIIYGGAPLTADRFGNPNSAYSFNGTTQYIQSETISKSITNKTYSAWVKLSTLNQRAGGLVGIQSSNGQIFDVVVYNETNNGWGFGSDNLTRSSWSGVKETTSEWAMITATYEQNNYKIYRNGILIGTTTQFGITNFSTTSKINIGYRHTFGESPFLNGTIDDVYIYDRVLTLEEINQLYKSTSLIWSTGASSNSITVSPTQTTKYYLNVSDGITTCTDSILVKVDDLSSFNPLPNTISQCGKSILLEAGENFKSYNWSNSETGKSITVTQGGRYSVTVVTNNGCSAADTTLVSLVHVDIGQNDTTICAPKDFKLTITDTLQSTKAGWELLIPATAYDFSQTNFREGGFDPENAKLYSVFKNGTVNRFYEFDLNTNSVRTLESVNPPSEIYDYVYDFTNSRIIGTRVGRDRMFSIPLTGGTWTPYGNGNFDAESYGCATYWNPISRRPGFFGGYGFFSVKNWVWENNGNGGWQNVFANTSNCLPPKRTGQIARNKLGDKIYVFSGQGSCDGNQFASSCSISQPWATDVGVFCWLKDLWELDLNTYTFKNILPPNSSSVVNEGAFTYDYNNDIFYNVGGYKPLPTYSPAAGANVDYDVEVYRYRRGAANGFELFPVEGLKPPVLKLSQYSGRTYYDAKNSRIIWARNDGIWALNLASTNSMTYRYKWSTGDTTTSITINPIKTTTYYVSVTDGITTCTDSVKITIEDPRQGIRYQTVDVVVNRPTELSARNFGKSFLWTPGVQLNSPRIINPIITATKQQQYLIQITTDAGCIYVDTLLVRVFPDRNIYVPDGFTPDGDGRNDRLYPILVGIKEVKVFRVFNRWGTLLYDNKNANLATGWDGTYKGVLQPMESYVWVAEGIDIDGKYIRRTGNSILIR